MAAAVVLHPPRCLTPGAAAYYNAAAVVLQLPRCLTPGAAAYYNQPIV